MISNKHLMTFRNSKNGLLYTWYCTVLEDKARPWMWVVLRKATHALKIVPAPPAAPKQEQQQDNWLLFHVVRHDTSGATIIVLIFTASFIISYSGSQSIDG